MGKDGAWAGHPEIYAAAWCYKVDITIYSKDYTVLGGSLVFKSPGMTEEMVCNQAMIHISYHDNNHFKSVRLSISSQANGPVYLSGAERLQAGMERTIKDHQEEFGQAIATATTEHGPMFPTVKITSIRENSWKIMAYIARQQLATGGRCVSEAQLEHIRDQAEEHTLKGAQKNTKTVPTPQHDPTPLGAQSPLQLMVVQYRVEITKTISNHRDSALRILKEVPSHNENSVVLSSRYEELSSNTLPIITGLANLIMHLGGEEIPHTDLSILADQAEVEALRLYSLATHKGSSTKALPSTPHFRLPRNKAPQLPRTMLAPSPLPQSQRHL